MLLICPFVAAVFALPGLSVTAYLRSGVAAGLGFSVAAAVGVRSTEICEVIPPATFLIAWVAATLSVAVGLIPVMLYRWLVTKHSVRAGGQR
jgi:hypothetical protein